MVEREGKNVGILAIGTYLPDNVRTNDWWDDETVERWRGRSSLTEQSLDTAQEESTTESARRVIDALAQLSDDPFQGASERRVMPDDMLLVEMEQIAAQKAIEKSGVDLQEIDLLLGFALIPDYLSDNHACLLHHRLGLPSNCFTLGTFAACNSLQLQLAIAKQMILSGQARCGLLVQSSAIWRVNSSDYPVSVHFGDGATAVVVGPVSRDRGILAQAHRTDGSVQKAVVCTVEGKSWWEYGRLKSSSLDRDALMRMFKSGPDCAKEVLFEALKKAGYSTDDVRFFACHQPTSWFRKVVQEYVGLQSAKTYDTYPMAGTLSSANLPLILENGECEGLLEEGDLVAMYQAGSGMTYSATILRWGR